MALTDAQLEKFRDLYRKRYGKEISKEDAKKSYKGKHLGIFDSEEKAEAYSRQVSQGAVSDAAKKRYSADFTDALRLGNDHDGPVNAVPLGVVYGKAYSINELGKIYQQARTIHGGAKGIETQQQNEAMVDAFEKSGGDPSKFMAIVLKNYPNANTEEARKVFDSMVKGNKKPAENKYQFYIDAANGDIAKARKMMTEDDAKVKSSGKTGGSEPVAKTKEREKETEDHIAGVFKSLVMVGPKATYEEVRNKQTEENKKKFDNVEKLTDQYVKQGLKPRQAVRKAVDETEKKMGKITRPKPAVETDKKEEASWWRKSEKKGKTMDDKQTESKSMTDKPPASLHEGKIIKDTESGKRYKSDGKNWVEIK